jgi:hypothetical protein
VIVKKGEHGALYRSRDERFITPAFPVEASRDPTGAGGLVRGRLPRLARALRRAGRGTRCARRSACGTSDGIARDRGLQPAPLMEIDREEIARRVGLLHGMVSFDLDPVF